MELQEYITKVKQEEDDPQALMAQGKTQLNWQELALKPTLVKSIMAAGFDNPSKVQAQAIPKVIGNKNLLCQARSGMGKTGVYLISILQELHLKKDDKEYMDHQALILVPTRELAHQVFIQANKLSKFMVQPKVNITACFGGIKIDDNVQALTGQNRPHIIIGTPGRLCDLIRKKIIQAQNIRFYVVDECDKILRDQNMTISHRFIMNNTWGGKQIMMLSATLDQQTKQQCLSMLKEPLAQVYMQEGILTVTGLVMFYTMVEEQSKFMRLVALLDSLTYNQVIIFTNYINKAQKVFDLMTIKLFRPIVVHSNLQQQLRIQRYQAFSQGDAKILICTDVFGRGIDISRVNLVINYDFPQSLQNYLHRAGRAGRFGGRGLVINFVRPIQEQINSRYSDVESLKKIQEGLQAQIKQLSNRLSPEQYI